MNSYISQKNSIIIVALTVSVQFSDSQKIFVEPMKTQRQIKENSELEHLGNPIIRRFSDIQP